MNNKWEWVDNKEKQSKEDRDKQYFKIVEGENKFLILSHCAPLAQKWDGKKYISAEEGYKNVSIKGVCWVGQEGMVKQAKLPYEVVKQIRALQKNEDWEFVVPFPHLLTLNAKNAGTKEVEYSLTASPKKINISQNIIDELSKKNSPEEIVEFIKVGKKTSTVENSSVNDSVEYPEEEINPEDIPW